MSGEGAVAPSPVGRGCPLSTPNPLGAYGTSTLAPSALDLVVSPALNWCPLVSFTLATALLLMKVNGRDSVRDN